MLHRLGQPLNRHDGLLRNFLPYHRLPVGIIGCFCCLTGVLCHFVGCCMHLVHGCCHLGNLALLFANALAGMARDHRSLLAGSCQLLGGPADFIQCRTKTCAHIVKGIGHRAQLVTPLIVNSHRGITSSHFATGFIQQAHRFTNAANHFHCNHQQHDTAQNQQHGKTFLHVCMIFFCLQVQLFSLLQHGILEYRHMLAHFCKMRVHFQQQLFVGLKEVAALCQLKYFFDGFV